MYQAKNLGQALMNQAKYRQAEPVLRETFAHLRRVFGDSHLASLEACSSLATLLVNTNRPREATEMCRGGLAQSTRTLGYTPFQAHNCWLLAVFLLA